MLADVLNVLIDRQTYPSTFDVMQGSSRLGLALEKDPLVRRVYDAISYYKRSIS